MADVQVKLPDGRVGSIPEENLKEAQKRGAVLVSSDSSALKSAATSAVNTGSSALKTLGESAEDLGTGVLKGATFDTAPMLVGGAKAGLGYLSGDTDDLIGKYRQYQDIERKREEASAQRSPYLSKAGELAGMVGGVALTGGASAEAGIAARAGSVGIKAAMKEGGGLLSGAVAKEIGAQGLASGISAIPYGAAGAAGSSKGSLIGGSPEEQAQFGKDVEGGALSGGLVGAGIGAAGTLGKAGLSKAGDVVDKLRKGIQESKGSALPREMEAAYSIGEEGKSPTNQKDYMGTLSDKESLKTPLVQEPTKDADKLVNIYYKGDGMLSKGVGGAVDAFVDESGTPRALDVDKTIKQKTLDFMQYFDKNPALGQNDDAKQVFKELQNLSDVKPTASAVMQARNNLYRLADSYRAESPFVSQEASDLATKLGQNLKEQVPGYKEASERLSNYRHQFGEGVLSGDIPLEYNKDFISQTKDADTKLLTNFKRIIQNVNKPGTSGEVGQEAFSNFLGNMNDLRNKDPKIFDALGISPEGLESFIQKSSDRQAAVSTIRGYQPSPSGATGTIGDIGKAVTGLGRRVLVPSSRYLGAAKTKVADFSSSLANATDEQLTNISSKLPAPLKKSLLSSIENKDSAGKNAVIFTLMQNPDYRKLVKPEDIGMGSEEGEE